MSTERELITKNIELSGEFSHYLFEHPADHLDRQSI